MANNIELFQEYVPVLDEVYQEASRTAILDGNPTLAQAGANANELIIPKMAMDGLADYSRNSGYVGGDVTLTYETVPVNYDRGRMFSVDSMDDAESAGVAFGLLAGEFIRTKVVPELDAFRFASYAGTQGIGKVAAGAALTSGEDVLRALRVASNEMDEAEVPMEERHLFITPTLHGMIADLDANKSREVMARFETLTLVPQSRFYTAIELKDGQQEKGGGYQKATGGKNINFMILHAAAVIQFPKHIAPKVVTPEQNPDADAWKFGYRHVGVVDVYENKAAGIYLHHQ